MMNIIFFSYTSIQYCDIYHIFHIILPSMEETYYSPKHGGKCAWVKQIAKHVLENKTTCTQIIILKSLQWGTF